MVLVLLQHSYLSANRELIPSFVDLLLWGTTYCAAVAFVSISGMMYTYFLYTQSNLRSVYRRYAARAAFLILVAHPAINVTTYYFRLLVIYGDSSMHRTLLERLFLDFPITDTIGVCLLVAPVFIIYFGPVLRGVTILTMLLTTLFFRAFVIPAEPSYLIPAEAIFGALGLRAVNWSPLVPWLAIFLTGSFVGQALARVKQGTLKVSVLIHEMNRAGIALAVCGIILTTSYKLLKMTFGGVWSPNLFLAIYPGQTTTLLPGYFAVLLWVLAALMQRIDISGRYDRFVWLLSIAGRTSLFTFVVQFAVVESVPALLGYKRSLGLTGFLFLFIVGQIIMWFLSYAYGRLRGWFQKNDYAECVRTARDHCSTS